MTDKSTLEQIAEIVLAKMVDAEEAYDRADEILAIAIQSPEAAKYWSDKHCEAVRTRLSALKMRQIWEKPECIVEAAEHAIRESK